MHNEPQQEHQWLRRLLGQWTTEMEAIMGPDQPPITLRGTDRVRMHGDLWVICEGEGEIPGGGTAQNLLTLGYDPAKKRYVGTFVASVMSHLWTYEGSLDATGNRLTLDTEGPDFSGEGKMARYQDIIEFQSDDHRVLKSQVFGPDGQWHQFLTAHYRRQK